MISYLERETKSDPDASHTPPKNALDHAGGHNFFASAANAPILMPFDAGGSALTDGYRFWVVFCGLDV